MNSLSSPQEHKSTSAQDRLFACVPRALVLLVCLVLLCSYALSAEITANKMAILNTDQGKVTQFEDGVIITDGGTRITAGKVEFYDQQNMAIIHGGNVSITTPTSNVVAESAQYLIGAKRTYLYRNVLIRQTGRDVRSQALVLDNATDQVTADGALQIVDAAQGIEITGGHGSFNLKTEDGVIGGAPQLKIARASGMTVTSDEMELAQSRRFARALGNVRALTSDAVLTAETLHYFLEQDSAQAFGNPVLTQKDNVVSGDRMSFKFEKNELSRIEVFGQGQGSPRLTQQDNRMQGRRISILFEGGHLSEIHVLGDSLQQPEVRQKSNHAQGDSIAFSFQKGEIEQVRVMGRTTGVFLTDDGDRIEVSGTESLISFKDGEARQVEVSDVRMGRLFRGNPKKPAIERPAPAGGVK